MPAALRRKGRKIGSQALLGALLADVLDAARLQIAHQRHVAMTLGDRLLVHTDVLGHDLRLGQAPAHHRAPHQPPGLVPADAQQLRRPLHIGRQQHLDGQRLGQAGESCASPRPRQLDLQPPMFGTLHAWRARNEVGHELTAVQVAPAPLGQVVKHGELALTARAAKPCLGRGCVTNTPTSCPGTSSSTRSTVQGSLSPNKTP